MADRPNASKVDLRSLHWCAPPPPLPLHPHPPPNFFFIPDMRWDDPRTEEEISLARAAAGGTTINAEGVEEEVDVSFTSAEDGLEILWRDPLQVLEWKDDVRLRDFEEVFFAEGGHLNGVGF